MYEFLELRKHRMGLEMNLKSGGSTRRCALNEARGTQTHFTLWLFAIHCSLKRDREMCEQQFFGKNAKTNFFPRHPFDNHRYYGNWVRSLQWHLITQGNTTQLGLTPSLWKLMNNSPQVWAVGTRNLITITGLLQIYFERKVSKSIFVVTVQKV